MFDSNIIFKKSFEIKTSNKLINAKITVLLVNI